MSAISVNTEGNTPISITGLSSGIDTSAIIKALVAAEHIPITHLTTQQEKLQAQQEQLGTVQSSLQQLMFSVEEFALPSLFETSQTAISGEPLRIGATVTAGAAVGGYQVEVTQLANAAQRTFAFASPAAEETLTIDGHEFTIAAGASAKEVAAKINASGTATVYAAVLNSETLVLSNRVTGATEGEFIQVTSAGALTEKAETAREGKDAEYSIDGVAGTSASNTLTEAIAGVTLTLKGVTTTAGAVTIDVQPPGPNTTAIEAQLQSFVKLYNTTVEAVQKQITTKPVAGASSAKEFATGTLFGDSELTGLLSRMRATMYEGIEGLPSTMSSPYDIGLGTGKPTGEASVSQSAVEGLIKLEPSKLSSAVAENPEAVEKMMQSWAKNLRTVINTVAEPAAGGLASRMESDETQITTLKSRILSMNENLLERQKALVATYAQLEAALVKSNAQLSWLGQQTELLDKN
jgi:flagellar hook-associated protein 2